MMDLQKILQNHQKYLNNNGGKKANLRGTDLSEVNLRFADLRFANLRGTNLSEANLRGTNLRGANLFGVKGISMAAFDSRGWVLICWWRNDIPYFNAGCHKNLLEKEALAHWGSVDYPDRRLGDMYISAVKFLVALGETK